MRGWIALALIAAGCSGNTMLHPDTTAELPSHSFMTLPRLARHLDLDYRGEEAGFIELSTPPDNVMLVQDSTRALVNGRELDMDNPCIRRGEEFVVTSADAEKVTRALARIRAIRAKQRPLIAPVVRPRARRPAVLIPAWRPQARARNWRYIVIHHSATKSGSSAVIHRGHRARGMDGLGYHFVIGNGTVSGDGQIEVGYRWVRQIHGAHARVRPGDDNRWNLHGIGICLVGDFRGQAPSKRQMDSLVTLVRSLSRAYGIRAGDIVPHNKVKDTNCPGPRFPWAKFKQRVR